MTTTETTIHLADLRGTLCGAESTQAVVVNRSWTKYGDGIKQTNCSECILMWARIKS